MRLNANLENFVIALGNFDLMTVFHHKKEQLLLKINFQDFKFHLIFFDFLSNIFHSELLIDD